MLQGLGYLPETNLPVLDYLDPASALAKFQQIERRTDLLCRTLPSQYEYLTFVRNKKGTVTSGKLVETVEEG
jgi:tryptophan halogenase